MMNEKLAKKLKKILAKAGLDEEQVDEIVDEVEEAVAEEVVEEDGDPVETEPVEGEVVGDEVVPTEEEVVEVAPDADLPIPPAEEVAGPTEEAALPVPEEELAQPTDGSIEGALQELAAQEGGEVPPTDVPPVPQLDPQIEKLASDLGEAQKTIEGLLARIDSLEEALTQAGVINGGDKLGDEQGAITPSANHDASADAFDDILRTINGK